MDIELEKLKKLEHALHDAIDILHDWQVEEVKQECPCADGIDSKACVGCEYSEDGKRKYKPYVTVDEFIQDFQERFPTAFPRPAYTMPLIWLRRKNEEQISFVTDFIEGRVRIEDAEYTMADLLDIWTFIDGSPVGKEC